MKETSTTISTVSLIKLTGKELKKGDVIVLSFKPNGNPARVVQIEHINFDCISASRNKPNVHVNRNLCIEGEESLWVFRS